jgi:hypothetical protein
MTVKTLFFHHFYVDNFFSMNCFATFPFDSIASNSAFIDPLQIFAQIYLFVSFWHCLQTLKPNTDNKSKESFNNVS